MLMFWPSFDSSSETILPSEDSKAYGLLAKIEWCLTTFREVEEALWLERQNVISGYADRHSDMREERKESVTKTSARWKLLNGIAERERNFTPYASSTLHRNASSVNPPLITA